MYRCRCRILCRSTGQTSQTECAVGTYQSDTGQTSCIDADAGYYVDSTGSDSQTECAAGTYQSVQDNHLA